MDQNLRTSEPRWTFTGSYKKEKVQSSLLASLLAAAIPPPTVFMAESINWISFHNKWLLPFYHLFVRSFLCFLFTGKPHESGRRRRAHGPKQVYTSFNKKVFAKWTKIRKAF